MQIQQQQQQPANVSAVANGGSQSSVKSGETKRAPSVREVINAVKWLVTADKHQTLDMLSDQYVKNQISQPQVSEAHHR